LLESNEAATAMNMVLYTMVELATWNRTHNELTDTAATPPGTTPTDAPHTPTDAISCVAVFAQRI